MQPYLARLEAEDEGNVIPLKGWEISSNNEPSRPENLNLLWED